MLEHHEIEAIAAIVAERILAASTPGRWLTLEEAMVYCKVKSKNTIHRWINEGYIRASKRTGSWIIDRQSIDDWFTAGCLT